MKLDYNQDNVEKLHLFGKATIGVAVEKNIEITYLYYNNTVPLSTCFSPSDPPSDVALNNDG